MAPAKKSPKSKKLFVRIVEAIVKDSRGNILLLKRSKNNSVYIGKWQLPGGKANKGESAIHAVKREIFEETGCNCVSVESLKKITFSETFKGKESKVELNIFICKVRGGIVLSKEHSEYKFAKASRMIEKILAPVSKKALFD
jgi:mutator protein MutT